MVRIQAGSVCLSEPIFETLVRARAMENAVWMAYCNMAGTEGGVDYWGGSRIIGPGDCDTRVPGEPTVCQAPYDVEALVCGTVDYELTHRFRPLFPTLRDLDAGMYRQLAEAVTSILD